MLQFFVCRFSVIRSCFNALCFILSYLFSFKLLNYGFWIFIVHNILGLFSAQLCAQKCLLSAIVVYRNFLPLIGNVVNGPIGKQMVDTLVESSGNFEVFCSRIIMIMILWKEIIIMSGDLTFFKIKSGFWHFEILRLDISQVLLLIQFQVLKKRLQKYVYKP